MTTYQTMKALTIVITIYIQWATTLDSLVLAMQQKSINDYLAIRSSNIQDLKKPLIDGQQQQEEEEPGRMTNYISKLDNEIKLTSTQWNEYYRIKRSGYNNCIKLCRSNQRCKTTGNMQSWASTRTKRNVSLQTAQFQSQGVQQYTSKRTHQAHPRIPRNSDFNFDQWYLSMICEQYVSVTFDPGHCSCHNTTCDYSRCNLTTIPQNLPSNITKLNVAFNNIQILQRDQFSRYLDLTSLDLSCNNISLTEEGDLDGLSDLNLHTLDLSYNEITPSVLPRSMFQNLTSLRVLRLHRYTPWQLRSSRTYPDVALALLTNLEELYILGLGNAIIGPGFRNMTSLRKLSLSGEYCDMSNLTNATFRNVDQITSLNISHCFLYSVETASFTPLRNLLELDISYNYNLGFTNLDSLMWGLQHLKLTTLIMKYIVSHSYITDVTYSMVKRLPRTLQVLIASGSGILTMKPEVVHALPESLKILDMTDTTILTDTNIINEKRLQNLDNLMLRTRECPTDDTDVRFPWLMDNTSLSKNNDSNPLIKWSFPVSIKLKRIEINIKSVDYFFFFHSTIMNIPQNTFEELDFSCSYLPFFSFPFLNKFKKLIHLNVRRSSIKAIVPPDDVMKSVKFLTLQSNDLNHFFEDKSHFFTFLPNLLYLDLSFNQLTNIKRDVFGELDNLQYLRLDHNMLYQFDVDISKMYNLRILDLSNTAVTQLPSDVRSHIDLLCHNYSGEVRVHMSGCPINCDCLNLDFLKWMVSSKAFNSFNGYMCRYRDTSSKIILDGYKETINILNKECAENYSIFVIVFIAAILLVCALLGSLVYRFRWKLRYLYYMAYLKFMDKYVPDLKKEFKYDVFLCYDSEDHVYVTRTLNQGFSRELEQHFVSSNLRSIPWTVLPSVCHLSSDNSYLNPRKILVVIAKYFHILPGYHNNFLAVANVCLCVPSCLCHASTCGVMSSIDRPSSMLSIVGKGITLDNRDCVGTIHMFNNKPVRSKHNIRCCMRCCCGGDTEFTCRDAKPRRHSNTDSNFSCRDLKPRKNSITDANFSCWDDNPFTP